ncbi:MAG TPA: hypothetical protein VLG49_03350 [Rhabdochlamydiaceae bacterium]|nr:hypothetical protein [Rhabdochlamydiaceae bacterium]
MNPADRKKMCTSCDGMIPIDAETCLYCTADQAQTIESAPHQAPLFKHQSLQDSLTSLYTPPYSSKGHMASYEESNGSQRSRRETMNLSSPSIAIPVAESESVDEEKDQAQGGTFWAVFMLSLGALLLNLGLLQLFFSDHGVLRLEWNSSYWFLYCLIALPLFYFGLKKANTFK